MNINLLPFFLAVALCTLLFIHVFRTSEDSQQTKEMSHIEAGEYYFGGEAYDLSMARESYASAVLANPQVSPLAWYQLGRIDFLEGKFDEALFKFNKQIEYFEDQVLSVHYMVGLTYGYRARQRGGEADWMSAESAFRKFIELQPDNAWARTDLAWVYFSLGEYEAMKPVLEKGLEAHPDHPWLLNMYGLAMLNTGHRRMARIQFSRAQEEAEKLTPEMWGRAYPGNSPQSWSKGLAEMRAAITHNLAQSQGG